MGGESPTIHPDERMKQAATDRAISDLLADLSDAVRLRMLSILEREELSVGEVAQVVQLPQSTVSRHLKTLSEGGWLRRRSAGPATLYRLSLDELEPAARDLWLAVRQQAEALAGAEEDRRRLGSVLAKRREDSIAFFGKLAGEWDELRQELFGTTFTADALLSLVPGEWVVADLGCGTGNAAEHIAPYVEHVIAVDQSEAMLEAARKRLRGAENVEYRVGTLEALPLPDESVDAATCLLVLHHVEDPLRVLREMRRVLRTYRGGGLAVIVDMVAHDRAEYREQLGHRHLGFDQREMERMLREAGFGRIRVRELPASPSGKGPGLFVAIARVE